MTLFYGLLLSILVMLITYVIYLKQENPGIVDVAWGVAIMIAGSFFMISHSANPMKLLYEALLLTWGIRLSLYLLITRIIPGHKDPRYTKIIKPWSHQSLAVAVNYLLQAGLVWFVALTFYPLSYNEPALTKSDFIIFILAIMAVSFETLADLQLRRAKQLQPKSVCQQGLWKYSRHPNYFFEVLFWLVIATGIFAHTLSLLSISAPLTLFLIMHYLTIPLTEQQSLQSKGDAFSLYQANTSRFLPWFPRTRTRA